MRYQLHVCKSLTAPSVVSSSTSSRPAARASRPSRTPSLRPARSSSPSPPVSPPRPGDSRTVDKWASLTHSPSRHAEVGLVFEYMQLKEIDKEAAQAAKMRATAENAAAAVQAHGALLPARMRVESYRNAFVKRLDRSEETYEAEVSDGRRWQKGGGGVFAGEWRPADLSPSRPNGPGHRDRARAGTGALVPLKCGRLLAVGQEKAALTLLCSAHSAGAAGCQGGTQPAAPRQLRDGPPGTGDTYGRGGSDDRVCRASGRRAGRVAGQRAIGRGRARAPKGELWRGAKGAGTSRADPRLLHARTGVATLAAVVPVCWGTGCCVARGLLLTGGGRLRSAPEGVCTELWGVYCTTQA